MTNIYFVRHAESDFSVHDGETRPLTAKGRSDCRLVTEFLSDKGIDAVLSSPYKRAVDTVADFAAQNNFEVVKIDGFRERKSDSDWSRHHAHFFDFIKHQWADFNYTHSDGECLADVQARNIAALNDVLAVYKNQNIAIGTHGTALSTIINHYENTYGFEDFMEMVNIMPWVVKLVFVGNECIEIQKINIFNK
ncbi:MAG: histidine phosphatase family protein [Oscillospiraceae bacterium]|nr:histidine phosphatase family protein [Oscillospiraceae bacterium]